MTCVTVLRVGSVPDIDLRPRTSWRRWIRKSSLAPWPEDRQRAARLHELLALLTAARAELLTGWIQGTWWSAPAKRAPAPVAGLLAVGRMPERVNGVCLIGALAHAGRSPDGSAGEVGRAIDAVYNAFWEARGQSVGSPIGGLEPLSAPPVRLARVQWLTRWNDQPGRTRDEVVDVVDRAIARTAQSLALATAGSPELRHSHV
jgi:hypothetical protein